MDSFPIFAPESRYSTLRMVIVIYVRNGLMGPCLDIKTAFQNANLDEEIYVRQPVGFEKPGPENLLCRPIKELHGLKQAGKQWNKTLPSFLQSLGFMTSLADSAWVQPCRQ